MVSKGRYWLITVPEEHLVHPIPPKHSRVVWVKGQLEQGAETGLRHWQFIVAFNYSARLSAVKKAFCDKIHAELSRSEAANEYVHKDTTYIEGTRFEWGSRPFKRNDKDDWDNIWKAAIMGCLPAIPSQVKIQHYKSIKQIEKDHMQPKGIPKVVTVYWGQSGTGKSKRAWEEAGYDAYPKDPNTKFWDGYANQKNVVIDEFRGTISISNILRWLDRYPVCVECKFGGCVLNAENIWITSNLKPEDWYPDIGPDTYSALKRRFTTICHFSDPFMTALNSINNNN